ncbi:PMS1 protein homolog 1-like [Chelonus insularis]|uniref:PMS1 protein homolog 1-like n=1 Tax=Chelonus insularis TaxID=460826 RepID=UPI00158E750E|nr:PMS1 protein homolog 1-like [Chelonus insularis]
MSIKALDKFTVKKLTTAQVITSIYSVVKELVENALDADANHIEVILQEKGLSYIEVRDNGKGIAPVDAPFMGLQAYTSKLISFDDLDSLESYGFRGEALSALCRVSNVKIITRTNSDDAARSYTLDLNGTIETIEFSHRSIGTTVRVENLFKNYPVRRQSISNSKKINQEMKDIEELLKDYGICRPEVRFSYVVDNLSIFSKFPKSTYKECLNEIYGAKVIFNYEFLNFEEDNIFVELAIPKKDLTDLTHISHLNFAHISVNARPIKFKEFKDLIMKLLSQHFDAKISQRKKPLFFLKMKVPYSYVDINLEPNKTAILLKNKSEILDIVTKLLVDYYTLEVECEKDDNTSITGTPAYFDTLNDSVTEDEEVANKKRKSTNENKAPKTKKRKSKDNDTNKENNIDNDLEISEINTDPNKEPSLPSNEPLSQLPKVDLGEDFSTQEIRHIPELNSLEVDDIMRKMILSKLNKDINRDTESDKVTSLDKEQVNMELDNIPEILSQALEENTKDESEFKSPEKITEEQWSKGHCLKLQGGTTIGISRPSGEKAKKSKSQLNKTTPTKKNLESIGFSKFCQITRERLLEKNPKMNSVELAKEISKEWKHLDSEERQYFRDLGRKENLSLSITSDLNKSSKKKTVSPLTREKNKSRLLQLIENGKKYSEAKKTEASNKTTKTIIPWDVTMNKVREYCYLKSQNIEKNKKTVIGQLKENVWIVNLNSQIWLLNSLQLFNQLSLSESENITRKDTSDIIETYLKRWLHEKDDMSLLHPIFNLN